jgi:hypothetical protein
MKWMFRAGLALTVLAFLPLIGLLIALAFGAGLGCAINEGSVTPCIVAGADLGPTLYTLFVGGWLMMVTMPFGLVGICLTLVALGMRASARRRGK